MGKIIQYNKLIRDNIPEILKIKGIKTVTETVDNNEQYFLYLVQKLREEVAEFIHENSEEEIADIFEVLYAIMETKNYSKEKIEAIRVKKLQEKGGFRKKIILRQTEENI